MTENELEPGAGLTYGDLNNRPGDVGDQGEQLREQEEQRLIREQAAGHFPDTGRTGTGPEVGGGSALLGADSDEDNASNDPVSESGNPPA
jgi:hypothetical protein